MKTSIYSLIACLLFVFVFTQCNSSPIQQNITQVVGQQWRDSITIDMTSIFLFSCQHDTNYDVILSAKGQALIESANLLFENNFVYIPIKYQPSHYEILKFTTGLMMSGHDSTFADTNTLAFIKEHGSLYNYSCSDSIINPFSIFNTSFPYIISLGFQIIGTAPTCGEYKIYYE